MEWREYVKEIVNEPSCLDNISITFSGESSVYIPPIIKTSILLLEKMIAAQGVHNVIVFPEKIQSSFIFAISKLIYNIIAGKIEKTYDPNNFAPGQKLKIKNCVMEFIGVRSGFEGKHSDNITRIWVKFSDVVCGLPIEVAPYFQLVNTNRRLSKRSQLKQAFKISESINKNGSSINPLKELENYKTHMASSIFYVTPILNAKELLFSTLLNGRYIGDILLVGQVDYNGEIRSVGAGQLTGVPALVLSSDLYSVAEAIRKGVPIQSIILDVSNNNTIISQLDALDELYRLKCPIVCVTDTSDSFELNLLYDRDFNIWRWDEESLTADLYGSSTIPTDKKTQNCANTKIEYSMVSSSEICESLQLLYKHRDEIESKSSGFINIYEKLFHYSFISMRNIFAISSERLNAIRHELSECQAVLTNEKKYITDNLYCDFSTVISNFNKIYSDSFIFPKINVLENKIMNGVYGKICIVIPDKENKTDVYEFWSKRINSWKYGIDLEVLYPNDYINRGVHETDITIVSGWFNNKIMRKILYSYNSVKYLVLLYDYEKRWQNAHTAAWKKALNNENNKEIIIKSFSNTKKEIDVTRNPEPKNEEVTDSTTVDELEEIDLILRENKYKQYLASGGHKSADETTEAYPVNFVGSYFSFYIPTHKIITATDIIVNDGDKIQIKVPSLLNVGDFVVIRESQKDMVREIADSILTVSGKSNCRELAHKWKDALDIESTFSSFDEIYKKLKDVGCNRDKPTIRRWMTDEEAIIPQSKEDLLAIALITEDAVLEEKLDDVFDAGITVKSAHIKAGKVISEKLRRCIADELQHQGDIDIYNIWNPIVLNIEKVGNVKILKIMDISRTPIIVDCSNTNKLLAD